ncbi:unnamed protein product [Ixodes persulcatus]
MYTKAALSSSQVLVHASRAQRGCKPARCTIARMLYVFEACVCRLVLFVALVGQGRNRMRHAFRRIISRFVSIDALQQLCKGAAITDLQFLFLHISLLHFSLPTAGQVIGILDSTASSTPAYSFVAARQFARFTASASG